MRRTANSSGVASLNDQRDSSEGFAERITGSYERLRGSARQYWVTRLSGTANGSGTIRVVDTDADRMVVVTSDEMILLIEYDDNDVYKIGSSPVRYEDFEDDLSVGNALSYEITDTRSAMVNSFTLTNR